MRARTALAVAGASAAAWHALPAMTDVPAVRQFFPTLQGEGRPDHVALTFDDGPDAASTPAFLDELERLDVRATFFLLGENVERWPDLTRRLVADGHEVGVHGWDHRNLLKRSPLELRTRLRRAHALIGDVTGVAPTLWRPPYGVLSGAGALWARELGMRTVLWGTWGMDWQPVATRDSVLRNLHADLRGGVTVLLHDSDCTSAPGAWRSALAALDPMVTYCRAHGLEVGTIGEHGRPGDPAAIHATFPLLQEV